MHLCRSSQKQLSRLIGLCGMHWSLVPTTRNQSCGVTKTSISSHSLSSSLPLPPSCRSEERGSGQSNRVWALIWAEFRAWILGNSSHRNTLAGADRQVNHPLLRESSVYPPHFAPFSPLPWNAWGVWGPWQWQWQYNQDMISALWLHWQYCWPSNVDKSARMLFRVCLSWTQSHKCSL